MNSRTTIALAAIAVLTVGCASHKKDDGKGGAHSHGMMCPKCETVWMSNVEGQGTKMQRFSSAKGMTCPDCDAMAKAYMDGDRMVLHDFPSCKVKPVAVTRGAPVTHERGTHP